MKKFIVTTTINSPTIALRKYSELKDWTLIVVGDLKTPEAKYRSLKNIIWLGTQDQLKLSKKLSNLIGSYRSILGGIQKKLIMKEKIMISPRFIPLQSEFPNFLQILKRFHAPNSQQKFLIGYFI